MQQWTCFNKWAGPEKLLSVGGFQWAAVRLVDKRNTFYLYVHELKWNLKDFTILFNKPSMNKHDGLHYKLLNSEIYLFSSVSK